MKAIHLVVAVSAAFLGGGTAIARDGTLWTHNGSVVFYEEGGGRVRIFYTAPSVRLPATLANATLFEGRRVGHRLTGTAYTFARGCAPAAYAVSGTYRRDQAIRLVGAAPRRAGCRIVEYSTASPHAELVFAFSQDASE